MLRQPSSPASARRIAISIALLACARPAPTPRWLALEQVRPENRTGVFLNERLILHFSEPLDPTSVHPVSVRILAADGSPARGELAVDDDTLVFEPAPVLASDLSDGGYRPGETYTVSLAGFPRPEGLRGRSGAPLERSLQWQFRAVSVSEPRAEMVFEDSSIGRGLPVILRTPRVAPGEPIVLEGEEPLDPSTLHGEDFVLRRERLEEKREDQVRPPLGPPIPLRARLVENYDKRAPFARGTARIELEPAEKLLEPGVYFLQPAEAAFRLRDFGGNPVALRTPPPKLGPLSIAVESRGASGGDVASRVIEHFFDASMRSSASVEGVDGMAWWSETGRVEVRFPAAAGSGADGDVLLAAREPRRDVNATTIRLAPGSRCDLDPLPGLVVLRAQGRVEIDGRLVRAYGAPPSDAALEALDHDVLRVPGGRTLSDALRRMHEGGLDVTVLIAGADLVIRGQIQCDGPLLLVAGGRIRALGTKAISARALYSIDAGTRLGAVFSDLVNHEPDGGSSNYGVAASLRIDPPDRNVLVAPLRYAVLSAPIPPEGGASRWHFAPRCGIHRGTGSALVRYIGERASVPGGIEREVVVDDPGALVDCPTLRLYVELDLLPGETWDPPWIDFVEIGLDRAAPGRSR